MRERCYRLAMSLFVLISLVIALAGRGIVASLVFLTTSDRHRAAEAELAVLSRSEPRPLISFVYRHFHNSPVRDSIIAAKTGGAMRWIVSLGAVIVATALMAPRYSSTEFLLTHDRKAAEAVVDVELVLAVDVSYSMDLDELAVQREGYAEAIVSKEFLSALRPDRSARCGHLFRMVVGQRPENHHSLADHRRSGNSGLGRRGNHENAHPPPVDAPPFRRHQILPCRARRKSTQRPEAGDRHLRRRAEQQRRTVLTARDAALAQGVTINGLPVMSRRFLRVDMSIGHLL